MLAHLRHIEHVLDMSAAPEEEADLEALLSA
jgi:hypothetical protein